MNIAMRIAMPLAGVILSLAAAAAQAQQAPVFHLQEATIAGMPNLAAIVALGRIAHDSVVTALCAKRSQTPFGHGASRRIGELTLFDSYHCSRYNTNTGVLTREMFQSVFAALRAHLDAPSQSITSAALRSGVKTG